MIEHSGPIELKCEGIQETLDLDSVDEATQRYSCGGWEFASFQGAKVGDGTWGTAVLTVQESIDGVDFHNTTVTIAAGGALSSAILTVRAPYCRVKVTTDNGGAARARVHAYFWNSNIKRNGA